MDERTDPTLRGFDEAVYEFRLAGRLDTRWAAWFDGLTVSPGDDGTTLVTGLLPDQAAVHGVLKRARDLGIALISFRRIDPASEPATADPPTPPTSRRFT